MARNTKSAGFTGRVDFIGRNGYPSHSYKIDGERVPGVTTIIGGGIPKRGLIVWSAEQAALCAIDRPEEWMFLDRDDAVDEDGRVVREGAVTYLTNEHARIRDAAGARGTHMHEHAEQYLATGEVPADVPEDAAEHIVHLSAWLNDWQPQPVLLEFEGFNRTHRYAGTGDAIVTLPAKPEWGNVLVDYKSKTKSTIELAKKKKRLGPYAEVCVQLAAYAASEFIIDAGKEVPLPRIDTCAAVCVYPDGYTFHLIEPCWDEFLAARRIYEFGLRSNRADSPVRPAIEVPERHNAEEEVAS